MSVRNYRGKEKWIQGIVRARTGPLSYQVEVAPNVIWRRHIDQLPASDNKTGTRDLESVTDIPASENENDAEEETGDIQEQQGTVEPNREMDEERRYPVRTWQEPIRLG